MILVTGAAGKTGQAIIQALVARKAPVRAFVFKPEQAKRVKALGAQEVVVGNMQDTAGLRQATAGARAIYLICPNMNPNELAMGQGVINAARESRVAHFVYHSVLHPQTEKMPHHWNKLRVEEVLFESGLDYTVLQPAAYMQNILAGWTTIVEQGLYQVPYPIETRLAMVDLADVAEAAAIVLTEAGHTGAIYELAGPEAPTQTEVADILSRCLGHPIKAQQIPMNAWKRGAKSAGLGTYQVETLIKMFRYYAQYHFRGNANVLGWLLKRPPTDFQSFVERVLDTPR